jgi:hypothetical protein
VEGKANYIEEKVDDVLMMAHNESNSRSETIVVSRHRGEQSHVGTQEPIRLDGGDCWDSLIW